MTRTAVTFSMSIRNYSAILLLLGVISLGERLAHEAGFHHHADSETITHCVTLTSNEEVASLECNAISSEWITPHLQSLTVNARFEHPNSSAYLTRAPPAN